MAFSGVASIFRLQGFREGARTFSSGATVEYDRNVIPGGQHDYLENVVNVANSEGASQQMRF